MFSNNDCFIDVSGRGGLRCNNFIVGPTGSTGRTGEDGIDGITGPTGSTCATSPSL